MTSDARLTSQEISDSIDGLGWRLVYGTAHTSVPVSSLVEAVAVAADLARLTAADTGGDTDGGDDGDGGAGGAGGDRLWMDVRSDRLALALRSPSGRVTAVEVALAAPSPLPGVAAPVCVVNVEAEGLFIVPELPADPVALGALAQRLSAAAWSEDLTVTVTLEPRGLRVLPG